MDSHRRYSMRLGFLSKRVYRKLLPPEWHREQLQKQRHQGNRWRLMPREAVAGEEEAEAAAAAAERQPVVVGTPT